VNKWPCKLDGWHHEFQCRSCVSEQWRHGSSWLQKLFKGVWGEDVDLNMPHGFRAFIRHLSSIILWFLLIAQFLQHLLEHLGDLCSITFVVLELANISVWKMNHLWACFSFLLDLWCNRGMHYRTCRRKVTTSAMGNGPYACHLEKIGMIRKKMRTVALPKQRS
jgi:hypothetical protein